MSKVRWVIPDIKTLKREYKVEVELKGLDYLFDGEDDFLDRVSRGKIIQLTKSFDKKIAYRSRTATKKKLVGLVSTYRSWPKYRNMDTVNNLYNIIGNGGTMDMPIIFKSENNSMFVLSGNTRLDIAFQLGVIPKVIIINVWFAVDF